AARLAVGAGLCALPARRGRGSEAWKGGQVHTLVQKHFLSRVGDLCMLRDRSGFPVRGDQGTVCSTTPDATYAAYMGPSYRMVADLADPARRLRAVDVAGSSGHPGSPHYDDQIATWNEGGYHELLLGDSQADCGRDVLEM